MGFPYKLEGSLDNKTYFPIVDRMSSDRSFNVYFDDFKPVRVRYVRLTLAKRQGDAPVALLDFTVFGKSIEE